MTTLTCVMCGTTFDASSGGYVTNTPIGTIYFDTLEHVNDYKTAINARGQKLYTPVAPITTISIGAPDPSLNDGVAVTIITPDQQQLINNGDGSQV